MNFKLTSPGGRKEKEVQLGLLTVVALQRLKNSIRIFVIQFIEITFRASFNKGTPRFSQKLPRMHLPAVVKKTTSLNSIVALKFFFAFGLKLRLKHMKHRVPIFWSQTSCVKVVK